MQLADPPPTAAAGRADQAAAHRGSAALRRRWPWLVGFALLIAGFAGLDGPLYRFALTLNTAEVGHVGADDFYQRTKFIWYALRIPAGVTAALVAFFAILLFHPRAWRIAIPMLCGAAAASAVTFVARGLIGRMRPNIGEHPWTFHPLERLIASDRVCFPSGEATAAFALACVLTRAAPRWAPLWYALATAAALARLVQGAHFLSDVVGGAMVGVFVAGGFMDRLTRTYFAEPAALAR